MAEDSGATGSPLPPNNIPIQSNDNLGISEIDHTEQQSQSLRRLSSELSAGKRALIRSNSTVTPMCTGARRRSYVRSFLKNGVRNRHQGEENLSTTPPKSGMKWRNGMEIDSSSGSRALSVHGRLIVQATKIKDDDVEQGKDEGTQYTLNAQSVRRVLSIISMCMFTLQSY